MNIKNNYERCVILNDLQRQLIHYKSKRNMRNCWDVWYKGKYFGTIKKIENSYVSFYEYDTDLTLTTNFMESLASYVGYVVEYYIESGEIVNIIEMPSDTPEKTIWSEIKKLLWRK